MSGTAVAQPGPDRATTIRGLIDEYRKFAELIGALNDSDWKRSTRCTGWQVRDVAGHVAGQAVDLVRGAIGTRTPDEQAAALRSEPAAEMAKMLGKSLDSLVGLATVFDDALWSAPSQVPGFTIGQGMHALLFDAYVHGDDIRAALSLPYDAGAGLSASLDFVLSVLQRDDVAAAEPAISSLLAVPADQFSEQTGISAHQFLLAATGRSGPVDLQLPQVINIFR